MPRHHVTCAFHNLEDRARNFRCRLFDGLSGTDVLVTRQYKGRVGDRLKTELGRGESPI